MSESRREGSYIGQAWLVIVLCLVFGLALAGVQIVLSGKISENKRNETYSVIPSLVEGAEASKTVELLVKGKDGKEARVYQVMGSDGAHRGWVVPAGGQGFGDRIELLVGLDARLATITGLYVLEQKETPGLGDYIRGEDFGDQFEGKATDKPFVVVKSEPQAGNEIRALTGATISSESVSAIVNEALANLKGPISERAGTLGTGNIPEAAQRVK